MHKVDHVAVQDTYLAIQIPQKMVPQNSQITDNVPNLSIWVTSKYNLHVVRIDVKDSHDQFCNHRQAENASLRLTVNAREDNIEPLLLIRHGNFRSEVDRLSSTGKATEPRRRVDELDEDYNAKLAAYIEERARSRALKDTDRPTRLARWHLKPAVHGWLVARGQSDYLVS